MSKKTLKTIRGRRRKYNERSTGQYGPSTFDALETPKGNIRSITKYIVEQITGMGLTVVVSCSNITKSQSQYLSVDVGKRRYRVRISDHILRHRNKQDFNIYTHTPYNNALHYMAFIDIFRKTVGLIQEGVNLGKFGKNGVSE